MYTRSRIYNTQYVYTDLHAGDDDPAGAQAAVGPLVTGEGDHRSYTHIYI